MADVAKTWEGRHDPDDEFAHEEVDPRVEQYLEEMNRAADDINKCENKYEDVRTAFQEALGKIEADLNKTAQRVGRKTVEKARPYFEALYRAQKAHYESRRTAKHFEDISSAYLKAKQAVADVEKHAEQQGRLDNELQEEMNQVNSRFIRADLRRKKAEQLHLSKTKEFQQADARLTAILKQRKKSIIKARPYFEAKARFDKIIRALKTQLQEQEQETKAAKKRSHHAMHMLMQISQEIHERRAREKPQHPRDTDASANLTSGSIEEEHNKHRESQRGSGRSSGHGGGCATETADVYTAADTDLHADGDPHETPPSKEQLSTTERIDREIANAQRLQEEQERKEQAHQQETQRLLSNAARYEEQHGSTNDADAVSTASTEATEDGSESVDEEELARMRRSHGNFNNDDDDNNDIDYNSATNTKDEEEGSSSSGGSSAGGGDDGDLDVPERNGIDARSAVKGEDAGADVKEEDAGADVKGEDAGSAVKGEDAGADVHHTQEERRRHDDGADADRDEVAGGGSMEDGEQAAVVVKAREEQQEEHQQGNEEREEGMEKYDARTRD